MSKRNASGVFMMEMIAAILFFILCTVICIQTFVKADAISKKAEDLNQSVLLAESIAEVWKLEDTTGLETRFNAFIENSNPVVIKMGFDKNGNICDLNSEISAYYAVVNVYENNTKEAKISIYKAEDEVYALSVKKIRLLWRA